MIVNNTIIIHNIIDNQCQILYNNHMKTTNLDLNPGNLYKCKTFEEMQDVLRERSLEERSELPFLKESLDSIANSIDYLIEAEYVFFSGEL